MSEKGKIARAAAKVSAATMVSRVLGYARDMTVAFYFGATGLSDTFFVAFRIPNLLRELFAEGSMSSAFIPVLSEYREQGEEAQRRLVRVTFTFIFLASLAACIMGIIFAPAIVSVIAPGFLGQPGKFAMTVTLTRVMFPFLLFISMAAVLMGTLNTRRIFFIPALAPAVLNVAIIASVILLVGRLGNPIMAVAFGVTVGGLLQFLFQAPAFFREGFSLRPAFEPSHPGLLRILKLLLPVMLGMAVAQINIVISSILASFLEGGSITYLFYSMRLVQFPVGVFGVAMATAVLPSLTGHALKRDYGALREDFSFTLRLLFFISIPAMAGLIALREPIVNLLFQRGAFDYAATQGTAGALMFYSLGIWAFVGVRIVTVTFYSMQDTRTPVKVAVAALTANVLLSLALMGPMRHNGLALANALSSMLNFSVLLYMLRAKLQRVEGTKILLSLSKVAASSAIMGVAAWWMLRGPIWSEPGRELMKSGALLGTILFSSVLYFILCRALRCEEASYVADMVKAKFTGKGNSDAN